MRTSIILRRLTVAPIVAAAMLAAVLLTSTANAGSLSADQLTAHGWTCVPFVPANRTSCFNSGLGRPFPGNSEPSPTYTFLAFDLTTGDYLGTGHLVRQDVYAGQPCAPGDDLYVFRAPIGYYECLHT
jgi:hypothetical protein